MRRGISGLLTLVGVSLLVATPARAVAAPIPAHPLDRLPASASCSSTATTCGCCRARRRCRRGMTRRRRLRPTAAAPSCWRTARSSTTSASTRPASAPSPASASRGASFGVAGDRLAVGAARDRHRGRRPRGRRGRQPRSPSSRSTPSPAPSSRRTPIPLALDGFGVDAVGNRIVVSSTGPDATLWAVVGASGRVERTIRLPRAAGLGPGLLPRALAARGRGAAARAAARRRPRQRPRAPLPRPDLPPPRRGAAGAQPAQAAWIDADTFVLVGIASIEDGVARTGAWVVHARTGWLHGTGAGGTLANERRRRRAGLRLRALPPWPRSCPSPPT